jgi:hypothetical protein
MDSAVTSDKSHLFLLLAVQVMQRTGYVVWD